ncbi:MAG TPA: cytochrome c oxidase subunit 3 family protein [Candidatus Krumholzibacteria bacterium]|nr:cytochrome c oxidase subunit 3 family protein [Candidatus Krumholzibacteria bacterium]
MSTSHSLVLAHHKDYRGSKFAIWLFLITEVILFGGMFLLYSVYRSKYPADFHAAAGELNTLVGTINTLILLTSSLTMALGIAATHHGNRKLALWMIALTVICAGAFMVNKYFEWGMKIHHGIYPGSPKLAAFPKGEILFFGLYFTMTGVHGIHVLVGMVLLTTMFFRTMGQPNSKLSFVAGHGLQDAEGGSLAVVDSEGKVLWKGDPIDSTIQRIDVKTKYWPVKERFRVEDFNQLENSGLYWHIVDIIWIFLFPLFYLIT